MNIKKSILAIATTVSLFSGYSQASLTTSDFLVSGDNSVITDTLTGNQWLSFNETYNMSAVEVTAETAEGGKFEGWSMASFSDINELAKTYLYTDSYSYNSQYNRAVIESYDPKFNSFKSAFGVVSSTEGSGAQYLNSYGLYKANTGNKYNLVGVDDRLFTASGQAWDGHRLWLGHESPVYTANFKTPVYGFYLFKDAETVASEQTVDVSVPALGLIGLLTLSLGALKRKSKN